MNKTELKEKWSKYTDTSLLVDQFRALYKANGHANSIHGVCTILDEYFTQKSPMIDMFMASNNYIGNMRIAVQKEFDRRISDTEIRNFFYDIRGKLNVDKLLEFVDADGKCFKDYLYTGKSAFSINNPPNTETQTARKKNLDKFVRSNFATVESDKKRNNFLEYMSAFRYVPYSNLQDDICVDRKNGAPMLRKGTKTSRAFNTVCQYYGVDKLNPTVVESTDENGVTTERTVYPYNKVFAEYSDLVSNLTRKMWFVISLNPLDYLTMSNGVSWHSCHSLGSTGCYKGGTLSYMLDKTSIITYVVQDLATPLHEVPKFYRQMFHYDNNMFMQNRLYPQGNDGATDLYDKFRGFMSEEFGNLLHINGEWTVRVGARVCKEHASSTGAHYKDYHSNDSCAVFYPSSSNESVKNHIIRIGHAGICAKCGKPYTMTGKLSHDSYDSECTTE